MSVSKGWNWEILSEEEKEIWKRPAEEAYYLLHRWKGQGKTDFLDLGCGLGRHTVFFGRFGFRVKGLDISGEAVRSTLEWAAKEGIPAECVQGDMLQLPYPRDSFDCVFSKNVISHTDTAGVKQAAAELYRVLREGGEAYLTLASKSTWGFRQEDWPLLDENTRIRMDEGPEKGIPHFYTDEQGARELFSAFEIVSLAQVETYYQHDGKKYSSAHYHILVKKTAAVRE